MANNKPKSQNNVNKNSQKAQQVRIEEPPKERKPINKKRLWIIIISAVLALAIIAGGAFGIWYMIYGTRFDYMSGNIDRYITLTKDDYLGYDISVSVKPPSELDVDERILQTLAKNKNKTPLYNGYYVTPTTPIANGWKLKLWYRGYTLDDDGNKIDVDGTCNFSSSTPAELEIGSGSFVSGFEISLIGKYITDYSKFTSSSTGIVYDNDIIVVTMNAMYPDGRSEKYSATRIDLADDDVDQVWGEGFRDAFTGLTVGSVLDDVILTEMDGGTAVYTDVKVDAVVRATVAYTEGSFAKGEKITVEYTETPEGGEATVGRTSFILNEYVIGGNFGGALRELLYTLLDGGEVGVASEVSKTEENGTVYSNPRVVSVEKREDRPITVETYFPYNYSEESLRGKTVLFDVYVSSAIVYETPELTESFITDTLKLTAESLSEYEGDTLTEKYRNMVKKELTDEYNESLAAQIEELCWNHLLEAVKYDENKLPKGELRATMNEYTRGFRDYWELYSADYESLEYAAMDYFGIGDGSKWKEYVRSMSVQDIVEKMVFYYIAREENLLSSGDEFNVLYENKIAKLLEDYLSRKNCKAENYATEAEYLAAVDAYRTEMIDYYTYEAIVEAVHYENTMSAISALANVIKP